MSLGDALAAWAATVRLPDAEAAVIYQRIVTTPASASEPFGGLGRTWWRDFSAGFAARMITSTRPVRRAA